MTKKEVKKFRKKLAAMESKYQQDITFLRKGLAQQQYMYQCLKSQLLEVTK